MKTLLIFLVSLTPFFLSLFLLRKAKRRLENDLRRVRNRVEQFHYDQGHQTRVSSYANIGDLSCEYNARSPFLRCAINPSGPCQNCQHYRPRDKNV